MIKKQAKSVGVSPIDEDNTSKRGKHVLSRGRNVAELKKELSATADEAHVCMISFHVD
jgi:hypothetical protein